MFGKGVYFADMSSKSANYCYSTCPAWQTLAVIWGVAVAIDTARIRKTRLAGGSLPSQLAGTLTWVRAGAMVRMTVHMTHRSITQLPLPALLTQALSWL